jgi:hypothetical protein
MRLTKENLEKCGWMFSPSLRLMVREHELGNGKWDVEMDSYRNVGTDTDPRWDNDGQVFEAANSVAELIAAVSYYNLAGTRDWIHGDKVEFF